MMYQVRFTAAFKKSYKLMKKRGFTMETLDEKRYPSAGKNT